MKHWTKAAAQKWISDQNKHLTGVSITCLSWQGRCIAKTDGSVYYSGLFRMAKPGYYTKHFIFNADEYNVLTY